MRQVKSKNRAASLRAPLLCLLLMPNPGPVFSQTASTYLDGLPLATAQEQIIHPGPACRLEFEKLVVSSNSPSKDMPVMGEEQLAATKLARTSDSASSKDVLPGSERPLITAKLESLTNEVLGKEIELLKLNTRFRLATTDKNRIKPWRVFLYNLGGSGASTAGITTIAAERWRTWRQPAKANRNTLKAGPTLLLIGHSIIAGGLLVEALLDLRNDLKQRKRGLDAKSTQRGVKELCDEIDEKLKEREKLMAGTQSLTGQDRAIALQEGLVLTDLRHMALAEYVQFHTRAKRRTTSRNVSYLNGLSAATTGGYLGSLCGLLAVSNRKPKLAGPAGIGFTISGANIATGPVLSRFAASLSGRLTKNRLRHELGPIAPAQLQEHLSTLKDNVPSSDTTLNTRLSIYEAADAIFKRQTEINAQEKKKADKEFTERCFFNVLVGGTKMGWGIQLMNAGFGFRQPPPTGPKTSAQRALDALLKPKSASQLFSQRVAQGATTYIPGTGLWIFDTLQARTRGELDVYTMGAQAALPHQKLKDRFTRLEAMENRLKEISP